MDKVSADALNRLLEEQRAYYDALGGDIFDQALDAPGGDELTRALDAFRPTGNVLELACGPGTWTGRLLQHAASVTAVDASAEMLAVAANRVDDPRVRFVQADLFTWRPSQKYDVVFMGFWLSHVPDEHFESFWSMLRGCLNPDGRVFFADDGYRTPDELTEGPESSVIQRRIPDGTTYKIVKIPLRPADLQQRLRQLGWNITVTPTTGPFFWGAGKPGAASGDGLTVGA